MARYIDADALIKYIEKRRLVFKDTITVAEALLAQGRVIRETIENVPTANVAPMEEVERLKEDIKYYSELEQGCFVTGVKNVIADTVRKMQDKLDKHFCHDPAFLGVEQRLIMDIIDQIAREMLEDST